jgi:hypothetical protein
MLEQLLASSRRASSQPQIGKPSRFPVDNPLLEPASTGFSSKGFSKALSKGFGSEADLLRQSGVLDRSLFRPVRRREQNPDESTVRCPTMVPAGCLLANCWEPGGEEGRDRQGPIIAGVTRPAECLLGVCWDGCLIHPRVLDGYLTGRPLADTSLQEFPLLSPRVLLDGYLTGEARA